MAWHMVLLCYHRWSFFSLLCIIYTWNIILQLIQERVTLGDKYKWTAWESKRLCLLLKCEEVVVNVIVALGLYEEPCNLLQLDLVRTIVKLVTFYLCLNHLNLSVLYDVCFFLHVVSSSSNLTAWFSIMLPTNFILWVVYSSYVGSHLGDVVCLKWSINGLSQLLNIETHIAHASYRMLSLVYRHPWF